MKTTVAVIAVSALLAGCAERQAYQRADDTELVTSARIDIQDFEDAATQLSESLIQAGVLGTDGEPSLIMVSQFVNDTAMQVDRDRLLKQIRITLNRAGVARAMSEDPIAQQEQAVREFVDERESPRPDYALSSKILEDRTSFEETLQVAYFFQMTLTEIDTGIAVWEEERRVVKQSRKSSRSW